MAEKSRNRDRLAPNKVRICITPTKDTVERLDELASSLGLSRSATCVFLISQGLESFDAVKSWSREQIDAVAQFMVPPEK